MAFLMYRIANATPFQFNTAVGKENEVTNKADGVEAVQFWKDNKFLMVSPTIINVLSITVMGLIYVMG